MVERDAAAAAAEAVKAGFDEAQHGRVLVQIGKQRQDKKIWKEDVVLRGELVLLSN